MLPLPERRFPVAIYIPPSIGGSKWANLATPSVIDDVTHDSASRHRRTLASETCTAGSYYWGSNGSTKAPRNRHRGLSHGYRSQAGKAWRQRSLIGARATAHSATFSRTSQMDADTNARSLWLAALIVASATLIRTPASHHPHEQPIVQTARSAMT